MKLIGSFQDDNSFSAVIHRNKGAVLRPYNFSGVMPLLHGENREPPM